MMPTNSGATGLQAVYDAVSDACKKRKRCCLTRAEARIVYQMTPGFVFTPGTTVEDVFGEMETVGLVRLADSARPRQGYLFLGRLKDAG